jgi:hypothetical protein
MDDVRQFLGLLAREVRKAQDAGDLDPSTTARSPSPLRVRPARRRRSP